MDEPIKVKVVKLEVPVDLDGTEIREVTVFRPKGEAIERFRNNGKEGTAITVLISDVTQLSPDQVRALDAADWARLAEVATSTLPNPTRT